MAKGYVPSWCTACYRKGRTGEHFMKIAKAGNIHNFCHPNSLLTLQVRATASARARTRTFVSCVRAVLQCGVAYGHEAHSGGVQQRTQHARHARSA